MTKCVMLELPARNDVGIGSLKLSDKSRGNVFAEADLLCVCLCVCVCVCVCVYLIFQNFPNNYFQ